MPEGKSGNRRRTWTPRLLRGRGRPTRESHYTIGPAIAAVWISTDEWEGKPGFLTSSSADPLFTRLPREKRIELLEELVDHLMDWIDEGGEWPEEE